MRTFNATNEASRLSKLKKLATLWKIERVDSTVFRFTDHDKVIAFGGHDYTPVGGVSASARQMQTGLGPQNLEVKGMLSSPAITNEDLRLGKYHGATVTEYLVDWGHIDSGEYYYSVYKITNISYTGEWWEAEMESLPVLLQENLGVRAIRLCRRKLGASDCKVVLSGYKKEMTVAVVSTQRRIIAVRRLNFYHNSDVDGIEYVENPNGDITQAQLVQLNDVPGDNFNADLWTKTPAVFPLHIEETNDKWRIYSGYLDGMKSEGTPIYNMFKEGDVRIVVRDFTAVPVGPTGVWDTWFAFTIKWHNSCNVSFSRTSKRLWDDSMVYSLSSQIYSGGSVDYTIDNDFPHNDFALRIRRVGNTVHTYYRLDHANYQLDTGWTLMCNGDITPTYENYKGYLRLYMEPDAASQVDDDWADITAIWKKPLTAIDTGDPFYSPPQLDPIVHIRVNEEEYTAYDESGVTVATINFDEDIPTDCQIHYVYTSNATGIRPNDATMIALSHYTSLAAFKAAIEADGAIDKYLFVSIILYSRAKTLNTNLNDKTPVISNPVLNQDNAGLQEADGYYNYGYMEWTSGANAGTISEVKVYTFLTNILEFQLKSGLDIVVGDTFDLYPGCDKLVDTCHSKFNNLVNFGGFPTVPGVDKVVRT